MQIELSDRMLVFGIVYEYVLFFVVLLFLFYLECLLNEIIFQEEFVMILIDKDFFEDIKFGLNFILVFLIEIVVIKISQNSGNIKDYDLGFDQSLEGFIRIFQGD